MAKTTKNDVLIPEIFTESVQGAFAQKNALHGSSLVSIGAAVVSGSFPGGADAIGNEVEVPYFGSLGEFVANAEGNAAQVNKIGQTSEKATVSRDSLAFEVTRWARNAKGGDPYSESARQIVESAQRAMDRRLINAAVAAGGLVKSAFSSSSPRLLDYDLMVDAKMMFGDEQGDIVGMVVHSKTMGDLLRLRDGVGRPLLTLPEDGSLPRFMGAPVVTADSLPLTGSTMSAITESGTSPPDIAITTNTPTGPWDLRIKCTLGGARGTAKIQFSVDGGQNWSADILTAASIDLIDPAVDSLIGNNGKTGLTISYENAAATNDNVWTAKVTLKVRTLLLKKGALGFWYNQSALALKTDDDILVDSSVGALHLYAAAIRYRRLRGGTKPGSVLIEHNVSV